ncbi:hypothetical protein CAOG_05527 [Capsaspora owczarzaki ATCC 30864]|uniref:RING-type domain-containing protein n=1 Tax=Capsaspora owczarzaki (strain ATCC 30864) TaxID=595528 RepID=A0A0D2VUE0_CAPO3|nr:hypothetical protein CAOG_05527 [Capsaspora owczarzaki ATCC 30864]KJE94997.1 hypothetical protein CAOG_005527 [Capsaspora owczarzaki ATCC 30864]|eukprot:XP_004346200.1 hypothetical protein CAOG_05527 [Capsaspora owczarzaki ATCC 30864]
MPRRQEVAVLLWCCLWACIGCGMIDETCITYAVSCALIAGVNILKAYYGSNQAHDVAAAAAVQNQHHHDRNSASADDVANTLSAFASGATSSLASPASHPGTTHMSQSATGVTSSIGSGGGGIGSAAGAMQSAQSVGLLDLANERLGSQFTALTSATADAATRVTATLADATPGTTGQTILNALSAQAQGSLAGAPTNHSGDGSGPLPPYSEMFGTLFSTVSAIARATLRDTLWLVKLAALGVVKLCLSPLMQRGLITAVVCTQAIRSAVRAQHAHAVLRYCERSSKVVDVVESVRFAYYRRCIETVLWAGGAAVAISQTVTWTLFGADLFQETVSSLLRLPPNPVDMSTVSVADFHAILHTLPWLRIGAVTLGFALVCALWRSSDDLRWYWYHPAEGFAHARNVFMNSPVGTLVRHQLLLRSVAEQKKGKAKAANELAIANAPAEAPPAIPSTPASSSFVAKWQAELAQLEQLSPAMAAFASAAASTTDAASTSASASSSSSSSPASTSASFAAHFPSPSAKQKRQFASRQQPVMCDFGCDTVVVLSDEPGATPLNVAIFLHDHAPVCAKCMNTWMIQQLNERLTTLRASTKCNAPPQEAEPSPSSPDVEMPRRANRRNSRAPAAAARAAANESRIVNPGVNGKYIGISSSNYSGPRRSVSAIDNPTSHAAPTARPVSAVKSPCVMAKCQQELCESDLAAPGLSNLVAELHHQLMLRSLPGVTCPASAGGCGRQAFERVPQASENDACMPEVAAVNGGHRPSASRQVQCPYSDCALVYCETCEMPWSTHSSDEGFRCTTLEVLTPAEARVQLTRAASQYFESGIRACPACFTFIERVSGCDHMTHSNCTSTTTARRGREFCFRCNGVYASSDAFSTMKTPDGSPLDPMLRCQGSSCLSRSMSLHLVFLEAALVQGNPSWRLALGSSTLNPSKLYNDAATLKKSDVGHVEVEPWSKVLKRAGWQLCWGLGFSIVRMTKLNTLVDFYLRGKDLRPRLPQFSTHREEELRCDCVMAWMRIVSYWLVPSPLVLAACGAGSALGWTGFLGSWSGWATLLAVHGLSRMVGFNIVACAAILAPAYWDQLQRLIVDQMPFHL